MAYLQTSMRGIMELVGHEGIVLEAYKDSVGVWTWGIGITNASGHEVHPRYKDNPQTLDRVFDVFLWALRNYEADVLERFAGFPLTENQMAGALSFHYNTGAILTASWPELFIDGYVEDARYHPTKGFMAWKNPPEIIERRTAEANLFFDGVGTGNTTGTVYPVLKPSYTPDWGGAQRVDIEEPLAEAMARAGDGDTSEPDPEPYFVEVPAGTRQIVITIADT